MKKILICILVAALLVFSIWVLFSSIHLIKTFVRYCIPDEMASSVHRNWVIFYHSCGFAALSVGGIVFSSAFFIKQLLKEKARKKMQELEEKLQKESAE